MLRLGASAFRRSITEVLQESGGQGGGTVGRWGERKPIAEARWHMFEAPRREPQPRFPFWSD